MATRKRGLRGAFCCLALLGSVHTLAQEREPVGLVLGGGGARGAAHLGVLRVLERENIPVDYIAGTSMGAIIGSLYASGYSVDEIEKILKDLDWADIFRDGPSRDALPMREKEINQADLIAREIGVGRDGLKFPKSVIIGQKLSLTLRRLLVQTEASQDFGKLPIPFRCVATNIIDTQQVVFSEGDLALSVLASAAIPGAFAPVKIGDKLLVDGGVTNNVPIDVARAMGARRLIVVNVGTPLHTEEQLTSPVAVLDQVISGMMERETNRSIETLQAGDVLIHPEMPGVSTLTFDRVDEAIEAGQGTAEEYLAQLRTMAVAPEQFAAIRATQKRALLPEDARIEFVDVSRERSRTAHVVADQLERLDGDKIDFSKIDQSLGRVYGAGTYQRVDYRIEEKNGEYGLSVTPVDKSWGPNFLRFGLQFEDDFNGRDSYQLNAEFRMTGLSSSGAEWRNLLQIGRISGLTTEFYAPFGREGLWFAGAQASYTSQDQPVRDSEEEIARYRVSTSEAQLRIGRDLNDRTRFSLSLLTARDKGSLLVGDPAEWQPLEAHVAGIEAGYLRDSLDSIAFPLRGTRLSASYSWFEKMLGADESGNLIRVSLDKPWTFGRNTFSFGVRTSLMPDSVDSFTTSASLGGLTYLSGYGENELLGLNMLFGRLVYYRRFGAEVSLLDMPLFVGGSIEAGNTWLDFDQVDTDDLITAGSVFIGIPLPIGPLRFGFGYAETGARSVYLTFGSYIRGDF